MEIISKHLYCIYKVTCVIKEKKQKIDIHIYINNTAITKILDP